MGDRELTADLTVEPTRSRQVFSQASDLYARVFGYTSSDHTLNPKLLSAIVGNGGAAVAATTATGELVGFAYGFVGVDGGASFLYSQAAFIDPAYQGRGIGRLLKQEQAVVASATGLASMRWAFDPTLARNAHFNLDVLGARGVRFAPNYYDENYSDRLIVEWSLATDASTANRVMSPAVTPAPEFPPVDLAGLDTTPPAHWGRPSGSGDVIHVPIPSNNPVKELNPALVATLRATVAETFADLFERGYVAESCVRVDAATAAYRFMPAPARAWHPAPCREQAAR